LALAAEAYELLAGAGRRAYARGDAPAASNLLGRALALEDGDLELRRIFAQTLWDSGEETDTVATLLRAVVDDAAAAGDRAQEWYARLDVVLLDRRLTDFLETASQAVKVFSELEDERGLSEAWRRLARAELLRCSYGAAEAAAERALHYARRCEERLAVARAGDALATALNWGPAPVAHAIPRCEQLLAEAEGNQLLRAMALYALAALQALEGRSDDARRQLTEAADIYRDLGLRMLLAGLTQIAAQIELLAGDPVAAETEIRAGLDAIAGTRAEAFQQGLLARTLVAQRRFEEARGPAEQARRLAAREDVMDNVIWLSALARVEAAAGNREAALELARDAVERSALTDGLTMRAEALLDLAAVLRTAGEGEEAAQAEREAAALYSEKGRVG
jgi:tetratricopeptide (TPR) repeat protein